MDKPHRFSSFGSHSATGGYTNPHPTIHKSEFHNETAGPGGAKSIHLLGIPGRNWARSATTTNTGLGLGFGLDGDEVKTPLSSLYLIAGLPKSHPAWTLADPDSVLGLQHSEGAVNKWWRPEVLGSTVSPGAIPTSTVHTFTFSLPTPPDHELGLPSTLAGNGGGAAGRSDRDVRSAVYSATTGGIGRGGVHHGPGGM
jgi:hypothetical protein